MRLYLKNIGKLSEADVELNAITVIAGENNTGKSTVGRVLYSMFNSFHNFENQIKNTRISLFSQIIKREFDDKYENHDINVSNIAKELFSISSEKMNLDYLSNLINHNVEDMWAGMMDDNEEDQDEQNNNEYIEELELSKEFLLFVMENYKRYYKEISDANIYISLFNRQIKTMFHSQFNNFHENENGCVSLTVKNKTVELAIENNQVKSINDTLSLKTEILYLDNPFILDEWVLYTVNRSLLLRSGVSYRTKLLQKLMFEGDITEVEEVFKEVVVNERISGILSKIDAACNGSLSFKSREGFSYKTDSLSKSIDINNISTGLKTFIIIKTLLQNGSIQDNGAIILDEPEVHLHPEWQILFAEIIVLLQKEFNLHILLTTHSPYFLEAIEVYSAKYKIDDKCKYYLSENKGEVAYINDVTDNTESIYQRLARPFQNLENERYSDD